MDGDFGFSRAWRGDLGLFRSAYGLGGLGFALVSLLGDTSLDFSASAGGATGWIFYIAVALGELTFAWVSSVATWRAAQRGRANGRRYGSVAIGLALAFVGLQLVFTAAWTGWSGLAGLGFVPEPGNVLLRTL